MNQSLTRPDLEEVKKAISDAEKGQATLEQLARAHAIVERVGGGQTLGIVRSHIRRMTVAPQTGWFLPNLAISIVSGVLVWLVLGRRGKVNFS